MPKPRYDFLNSLNKSYDPESLPSDPKQPRQIPSIEPINLTHSILRHPLTSLNVGAIPSYMRRMEGEQVHGGLRSARGAPRKSDESEVTFLENGHYTPGSQRRIQDIEKKPRASGRKSTDAPYAPGRNTLTNQRTANEIFHGVSEQRRSQHPNGTASSRTSKLPPQITTNHSRKPSGERYVEIDDEPEAGPSRHPTSRGRGGFGSHAKKNGEKGRTSETSISPVKRISDVDSVSLVRSRENSEVSEPVENPDEAWDIDRRPVETQNLRPVVRSSNKIPGVELGRRPKIMMKKDGTIPETKQISKGTKAGPKFHNTASTSLVKSAAIPSSNLSLEVKIVRATCDNARLDVTGMLLRNDAVALFNKSRTHIVNIPFKIISGAPNVCPEAGHPVIFLTAKFQDFADLKALENMIPDHHKVTRGDHDIILQLQPGSESVTAIERFAGIISKGDGQCLTTSTWEPFQELISRAWNSEKPQKKTYNISATQSNRVAHLSSDIQREPKRRRPSLDSNTDAGPSRPRATTKRKPEVENNQTTLAFSISESKPRRRSNRISGQGATNSNRNSPVAPEQFLPLPADRNEELFAYPLTGRSDLSITKGDRWRIEAHEFLNDILVDFGLRHAISNLPPGQSENIHLFNSFFYNKISAKGRNKRDGDSWPAYDNVRKWTKGKNLFEKKFIVVPINEHFHWYFAVIYNPSGILGIPDSNPNPDPDPPPIPNRPVTGSLAPTTPDRRPTSDIPDSRSSIIKQQDEDDLEILNVTESPNGTDTPNDADISRQSIDPIDVISEPNDGETSFVQDDQVSKGVQNMSIDDNSSETDEAWGQPIKTSVLTFVKMQNELVKEVVKEKAEVSPGKKKQLEDYDVWGGEGTWILTFDSLGGAHKAVGTCLTEWLKFEALDKVKDGRVPIKSAQYLEASVPLQPNSSDCGLYLVHYAEQLLSRPQEVLSFIQRRVPYASKDDRPQWDALLQTVWRASEALQLRQTWIVTINSLADEYKRIKATTLPTSDSKDVHNNDHRDEINVPEVQNSNDPSKTHNEGNPTTRLRASPKFSKPPQIGLSASDNPHTNSDIDISTPQNSQHVDDKDEVLIPNSSLPGSWPTGSRSPLSKDMQRSHQRSRSPQKQGNEHIPFRRLSHNDTPSEERPMDLDDDMIDPSLVKGKQPAPAHDVPMTLDDISDSQRSFTIHDSPSDSTTSRYFSVPLPPIDSGRQPSLNRPRQSTPHHRQSPDRRIGPTAGSSPQPGLSLSPSTSIRDELNTYDDKSRTRFYPTSSVEPDPDFVMHNDDIPTHVSPKRKKSPPPRLSFTQYIPKSGHIHASSTQSRLGRSAPHGEHSQNLQLLYGSDNEEDEVDELDQSMELQQEDIRETPESPVLSARPIHMTNHNQPKLPQARPSMDEAEKSPLSSLTTPEFNPLRTGRHVHSEVHVQQIREVRPVRKEDFPLVSRSKDVRQSSSPLPDEPDSDEDIEELRRKTEMNRDDRSSSILPDRRTDDLETDSKKDVDHIMRLRYEDRHGGSSSIYPEISSNEPPTDRNPRSRLGKGARTKPRIKDKLVQSKDGSGMAKGHELIRDMLRKGKDSELQDRMRNGRRDDGGERRNGGVGERRDDGRGRRNGGEGQNDEHEERRDDEKRKSTGGGIVRRENEYGRKERRTDVKGERKQMGFEVELDKRKRYVKEKVDNLDYNSDDGEVLSKESRSAFVDERTGEDDRVVSIKRPASSPTSPRSVGGRKKTKVGNMREKEPIVVSDSD